MNTVSYLTINGETREIIDRENRDKVELLEAQIEYLAEQLNIDISEVTVEEQ